LSFRELLSAIYSPEQNALEGFIELRVLNKKTGEAQQKFASSIADADRIAEVFIEETKRTKSNVYYGVNPRASQSGKDVPKVYTVVADIDKQGTDNSEALFEGMGIKPSAVVNSGGGGHAYWFLTQPVLESPEFQKGRASFEKLGKGKSDAVHDPERILRVPGSQNYKYSPSTDVVLVTCNAARRYQATIFEKMERLTDKVRHLIFIGDLKGFRSRSERDWNIVRDLVECGFTDEEIFTLFAYSPANTRYQERWPGLLEYDIENAREKLAMGDISGPGAVDYVEMNNCYYRKIETGLKQISTFVLEPAALMQGDSTEEDHILCNIMAEGSNHAWNDIQIPRHAFIDKRSFNKQLSVAAWMWLGSDQEVTHLLPYLMKKIQANNVPIVRTVKSLGRHGTVWIDRDGVISASTRRDFSEAGYMYLERAQVKPQLEITFPDSVEPLIKEALQRLHRANRPQVMWPAIGWLFATFYKPLLGPQGRGFPILQVIGSRGAGKTSLIRSIFLPLAGYNPPESYTCDTTDFVMLTLMGFSTTTPIFFGEYRASLPSADRFLRRLRLSYDSGADARGRGDQTTVSYPLVAPIIIDGENPADEPAVLERSIVLALSPEDLDDEKREMYYSLSKMPLYEITGAIIRHSLNNDPQTAEAVDLVQKTFGSGTLPDRIENNLVTCVIGLLAYKSFALAHNAYTPTMDVGFIREAFADVIGAVTLGDTGRTKILVDELIEDVLNHIALQGGGFSSGKGSMTGQRPFVWRYDRESNEVSFHLGTTLNWWTLFRRQRGLATLTSATAKSQLRERVRSRQDRESSGQYISGIGTKGFGMAGTFSAYTVDVNAAKAAALDVPDSLLQMFSLSSSVLVGNPRNN
jgi:hypothetical protein